MTRRCCYREHRRRTSVAGSLTPVLPGPPGDNPWLLGVTRTLRGAADVGLFSRPQSTYTRYLAIVKRFSKAPAWFPGRLFLNHCPDARCKRAASRLFSLHRAAVRRVDRLFLRGPPTVDATFRGHGHPSPDSLPKKRNPRHCGERKLARPLSTECTQRFAASYIAHHPYQLPS